MISLNVNNSFNIYGMNQQPTGDDFELTLYLIRHCARITRLHVTSCSCRPRILRFWRRNSRLYVARFYLKKTLLVYDVCCCEKLSTATLVRFFSAPSTAVVILLTPLSGPSSPPSDASVHPHHATHYANRECGQVIGIRRTGFSDAVDCIVNKPSVSLVAHEACRFLLQQHI